MVNSTKCVQFFIKKTFSYFFSMSNCIFYVFSNLSYFPKSYDVLEHPTLPLKTNMQINRTKKSLFRPVEIFTAKEYFRVTEAISEESFGKFLGSALLFWLQFCTSWCTNTMGTRITSNVWKTWLESNGKAMPSAFGRRSVGRQWLCKVMSHTWTDSLEGISSREGWRAPGHVWVPRAISNMCVITEKQGNPESLSPSFWNQQRNVFLLLVPLRWVENHSPSVLVRKHFTSTSF